MVLMYQGRKTVGMDALDTGSSRWSVLRLRTRVIVNDTCFIDVKHVVTPETAPSFPVFKWIVTIHVQATNIITHQAPLHLP